MAPRIVIAGGGFAGVECARALEAALAPSAARVTLVNDTNHLLYTPLLPEAAAGVLEPRHVVTPLRELLSHTQLQPGAVCGHDADAKTVLVRDHDGVETTLAYDHLVVAVGSVARSLPVPGLKERAIGFKSLADAIWLRNRIIQTLESANATADPVRREELLTYVVVGGGYSGLEALAEAQDFAAQAITRYPVAAAHGRRWVLVHTRDHVLPEVGPKFGRYALSQLAERGIEIRLTARLAAVDHHHATLGDGTRIPTKTVIWTAGVAAHPSLAQLDLPLADSGRVQVDEYLAVSGRPGVWALGDCAAVPDPRGGVCPPTAQHAIRQGRLVAANVLAGIRDAPRVPFSYKSRGAFVNLGRYRAIAQLGPLRFSGVVAWWLTRAYHLSQLPGRTRRLRALIDWTVSLPFGADTSEIGTIGTPRPLDDAQYRWGGTHRPIAREPAAVAAHEGA